MAEETEGQDTGAEASGAGVDPFAAAMALGGASRETADTFLKNQNSLIDIQKHHLTEQFKHQLNQLRLKVWEQRFGLLLRIATGFVGLAIAAGLAFMVWDASQSSGLLIEPFSVPPDLASRGLTGQVVATQILDKLTAMQNETLTARPAKTYANNWAENTIKLDIPETGVSLSELDDFLREKLGHDTHISGEIIRTANGVTLTARAGSSGAKSVTGSESDFDGIVQKSAEGLYRITQPFRYGMYLASHDRLAEAISLFKAIAETGLKEDRPWGFANWGRLSGELDGIDTAQRLLRSAIAEDPENALAQLYLMLNEKLAGQPEQSTLAAKNGLSILLSPSNVRSAFGFLSNLFQSNIAVNSGASEDAAQDLKKYSAITTASSGTVVIFLAYDDALNHDLATARAVINRFASTRPLDYEAGFTAHYAIMARMQVDTEAQNWAGVLSEADAYAPMVQNYPGMRSFLPTTTVPITAYAEARLGKIADAEAHISATPADCYDCLITRARIAELQGQHARADWWFSHAIDGQKSIPFAYSYWGQALMGRGDLDGAIEKFKLANQKGPKFADPLEMWGEALIAKNQSHLALAKFEEADKYAPNWGRLHLKWGEALGYAGRKDDARAQYQKALTLDLTAADKAELAKVSHG